MSIPPNGLASIRRASHDLSEIQVRNMGRVSDKNGRKIYGVSPKDAQGANPYMGIGADNGHFFVHTWWHLRSLALDQRQNIR
jgi:hypothetical protein